MKTKFLQVLLFVIVNISLFAQPQISYIIPDIGTPNFATYVEIISPFDPDNPNLSTGNFGNDGLVIMPIGQVRTLNSSDAWKLTFSPMIVSWDGRLISVQVFVNQSLKPNSWYWEELNPEFRIPIVVELNGQISDVDTFYIVQPQRIGDIRTNPDRVIGEGTLGKRSRRGAMIVDSILFANDVYKVSTQDCDPISLGNQGYLPFILLSKGRIQGLNNTIINVSGEQATNGHGGNGGPGGGGGGGRFCDVIDAGDNGGNGFTSGGRGGRNASGVPLMSNKFESFGQGSGSNGASLNGIYPPKNSNSNYEASGGGTGHPFGIPGIGTGDGYVDNPAGGYGGGSGFTQNKNGGSAGYGTKGQNSLGRNSNNQFSQSGGNITGNDMVVPIAGGSGGASGNPNSLNECSGSGGGGGGAIVIYAPIFDNVTVYANGADGSNGTGDNETVRGGSGSGGYAGIFSKTFVNKFGLQCYGGFDDNSDMSGGAGRMRYDLFSWNIADFDHPAEATKFRGLTTDTLSYVTRKFDVSGSRGNNKTIYAYIKGESGNWRQVSGIQYNNDHWILPVDLYTNKQFCDDSIFYFVALQEESRSGSIDEHNMSPDLILSQAAYNIFRIIPDIQGDSLVNTNLTVCQRDETDTIRFEIRNEGGPILELNVSESYFDLPSNGNKYNGFKLINPDPNVEPIVRLNSCESKTFTIVYQFQEGHIGTISTTYYLPHNDSRKNLNDPQHFMEYPVNLSVKIDSFAIRSRDDLGKILNITNNVLDLGEICIGDSTELEFRIQNLSSMSINLRKAVFSNDDDKFSVEYENNGYIPEASEAKALMKFRNADKEQTFKAICYISPIECDNVIDSFGVVVKVVKSNLEYIHNNDTTQVINFGVVKVGASANEIVEVINNGSSDAYISQNAMINQTYNDFAVTNYNPTLPFNLLKNSGNKLELNIQLSPSVEGPQSATLTLVSDKIDNSCGTAKELILLAEGRLGQVEVTDLDFGLEPNCENQKYDTIFVKNSGQVDVNIIKEAEIIGKDAANFKIINQRSVPYTLKTNEIQNYIIEFNPKFGMTGPKSATFHITTDDVVNPDVYSELTGETDSLYVYTDPKVLNFGGVPVPDIKNASFDIINDGNWDVTIDHIEINDNLVSTSPDLNGYVLTAGSKITVNVTVNFNEIRDITALIKVIFNNPCNDTLKVNVYGTGLEGEWTYNNYYDFGSVAFCETSSQTFTFTNIGIPEIEIRKAEIVQTDNNFNQKNPPQLPITLQKDDVYKLEIVFSPLNSTDGEKTAQLVVEFFVNGELKSAIINLRGERNSGLLASPSEINFGDVFVKQPPTAKELSFKLTNIGDKAIEISQNWQFLHFPTIFEIVSTDPILPVSLDKNESVDFKVRFKPNDVMIYRDSLTFEITKPCQELRIINVEGRGIPAIEGILSLPDLVDVNPSEKNFAIPIYLNTDTVLTAKDFVLNTSIKMKDDVFLPKNVTNNGKIISNTKINGDRILEIAADNLSVNSNGILIEIIGDVLLGKNAFSNLEFVSATLNSETIPITTTLQNGSLSLKICKEGGDRLIQESSSGNYIMANPNPASSYIKIKGFALEEGLHRINLINLNGIEIKSIIWYSEGSEEFEFEMNISDLSSGIYNLIMFTPNRVKSFSVSIIK